jgi:hypothetical protein
MSKICLEALRNATKTSVTEFEDQPEIQIEHLSNSSKERYFYPSLIFEFVLIGSSKIANLNCARIEVSKLH